MKSKVLIICIFCLFVLFGCQNHLETNKSLMLNVKKDYIYLDEDIDATGYILDINGKRYNTNQSTYQLSNGSYDIKYKIIYEDGETDFSDVYEVDINLENDMYHFRYSKHSTNDLILFDVPKNLTTYQLYASGIIVEEALFIKNHTLSIDSNVLKPLFMELEKLELELITNQGYYKITIDYIDETKPYVTTPLSLIYTDQPMLSYRFDLFNSEIIKISTNTDYDNETLGIYVENNTIYIPTHMIESIFSKNQDISKITINYQLQDSELNTTYVGFVHILRNE